MLRQIALMAALPWVALAQAPTEPAEAAKPLDIEDPAQCAACHETIVREWRQSMHARSHHSQDPVYAGMRTLRMKKQGAKVAESCAQCHTPRAPSAAFQGIAATGGITCASCHNVATVHDKGAGAKRTTRFPDNTLVGPNTPREGMNAPHGLGPSPAHFKDGYTLCLTCHEQAVSPKGVVLCNTGPEFGDAGGAFPQQRCVDCHMPVVNGPSGNVDRDQSHTSHLLATDHHRWYWPEQAGEISPPVELTGAMAGTRLTVTIANITGHGYPTGFPGRMAVLKLVGKDAAGTPVWTNFEKNPMKESPDSVLNAVFGDADGTPTLPPMATQVLRDNRLRPGETRAVHYTVPAAVQTVQAVLVYRLIPPPAAKAFGLTEAPEAQPRPVMKATFTRK